MDDAKLKRIETRERFLSHLDRGEPDHCWPWTGTTNGDGYGVFKVNGRTTGAHRYSYEFFRGPVEPGMVVRHDCDNPPCCNPHHLRQGSHLENMRDKVTRGRASSRGPDKKPRKSRMMKWEAEMEGCEEIIIAPVDT